MKITILTVPQADRATRYLAVSDKDARAVARDRAQIECVTVLGCLDVYPDGSRDHGRTGPLWRDVPELVRAALLEAAR